MGLALRQFRVIALCANDTFPLRHANVLCTYCILYSIVILRFAGFVVHPDAAVVTRKSKAWPAGTFIETDPLSSVAALLGVTLTKMVWVVLSNAE